MKVTGKMRQPKAYILIGVPASGKSTWAKDKLTSCMIYCSTDAYIDMIAGIKKITYSQAFDDNITEATSFMLAQVSHAVKNNLDLIWDQTNLTSKSRISKLKRIPDHYMKIGIVFKQPEQDELYRRLDSRPGKVIPAHVLNNMIQTYERPEISEGFHVIKYL